MSKAQFEEVVSTLKEPGEEEILRRRRQMAEALAEGTGLREELLEQGEAKGLQKGREEGETNALLRLFAYRLGRDLEASEQKLFREKLPSLEPGPFTEFLFQSSPKELLRWLHQKSKRS